MLPYEWNTGAEQTGVSSINEPIMIISNDQLSSTTMSRGWTHIFGKLRYAYWDATRLFTASSCHASPARATAAASAPI